MHNNPKEARHLPDEIIKKVFMGIAEIPHELYYVSFWLKK